MLEAALTAKLFEHLVPRGNILVRHAAWVAVHSMCPYK